MTVEASVIRPDGSSLTHQQIKSALRVTQVDSGGFSVFFAGTQFFEQLLAFGEKAFLLLGLRGAVGLFRTV